MAKAHQPELLGLWARENGFESIARNYHPQEVAKRRAIASKPKHRREEYTNQKGKRR